MALIDDEKDNIQLQMLQRIKLVSVCGTLSRKTVFVLLLRVEVMMTVLWSNLNLGSETSLTITAAFKSAVLSLGQTATAAVYQPDVFTQPTEGKL